MTFRMCSKLGRFIEFRPSAGRCILVLLGLVSMVEALSTFTLIVRDLADLRWLDRVAGIWIAVVQTLAEGRGYPPLIGNDGTYGGVRYMPIYPLIINALSSLTGEYIVAGKLASLACLVLFMRRCGPFPPSSAGLRRGHLSSVICCSQRTSC